MFMFINFLKNLLLVVTLRILKNLTFIPNFVCVLLYVYSLLLKGPLNFSGSTKHGYTAEYS